MNRNILITGAAGFIGFHVSKRFLKDVQNCKNLKNGQLDKLNIEISKKFLKRNNRAGIF